MNTTDTTTRDLTLAAMALYDVRALLATMTEDERRGALRLLAAQWGISTESLTAAYRG